MTPETTSQNDRTAAALHAAFDLAREMLRAARADPECAEATTAARQLVECGARYAVTFAFGAKTEILLAVVGEDADDVRCPIANVTVDLAGGAIH